MTTDQVPQPELDAAVCEALGVPQKDWPLFSRWAAGPLTPKEHDALNSVRRRDDRRPMPSSPPTTS